MSRRCFATPWITTLDKPCAAILELYFFRVFDVASGGRDFLNEVYYGSPKQFSLQVMPIS
jgi:hypothetical protein